MTLTSLVVPSVGQKGEAVALSAIASSDQPGATLTYNWSFGDGATASGSGLADLTHAFNLPSAADAPYDISLTVSDGTPDTATADGLIAIDDVPPSVDLGPAQTVRAGDAVTINAAVADPAGPGDVASIQWDFNYDGSTFNADSSANGQTQAAHTYTAPGTYIVEVQATDLSGATSTGATAVVVKPPDALIVQAGPDQSVTESGGAYPGATVSFNGSYSDPGGTVSSSGVAWDFNYDGQHFYPQSIGTLTPSWTYYQAGTYQAALQITDSNGATDLSVMQVTVAAPSYTGPTATAGADQTINEGATATFGGSCTDPDGTVNPYNVAWDFNYDGTNFQSQATARSRRATSSTPPGPIKSPSR